MKGIQISYDLTKYHKDSAPLSIRSFTLREVTGKDEETAGMLTRAKGGQATVLDELVRMSITEVDGQPVNVGDGVPLAAYDEWNMRTRTFVINGFKQLNGAANEETSDFLSLGKARKDG